MIIDCISDLHGHYPKLEGGDLLIVAGDLTARDDFLDWQTFATWLTAQKYRRKIFIGGNHDNYLQECNLLMPLVGPQNLKGVEYLCDSGTEFPQFWSDENNIKCGRSLKIWGSPWTKRFEGMNPNCMAFTVETEEELADKFEPIPEDVDILITHCPPRGILDKVRLPGKFQGNNLYEHVGSNFLMGALIYCFRPKLWVCGHVHEGYGQYEFRGETKITNASYVNELYEPVNKPIRIIL